MKKIFGSMSTYYQNADEIETYGAISASYSFMKNQLKYGTFDEYIFFLPPRRTHYFKSVYENGFSKFLKNISLPKEILKKIRTEPLDRIDKDKYFTVFHNTGPDVSRLHYYRDLISQNGNFPVVNFVHAIAPQGVGDWFLKNMLSTAKPYDAHICPSNSLAVSLKKYYELMSLYMKEYHNADIKYSGRIEVLPLGVDTTRFKPRNRAMAREMLKLHKDRVTILCITRLTPFNKMDLFPLIKAFKLAVDIATDKDSLLLIVGKEQLKGYASSLKKAASLLGIPKNVEIRVNVHNDDIPIYYNASDVFVSPSDNLQETFGLTPIEAMLSKLPVVISDWDGYKEVVDDGINGFRVPTVWGKCNTQAEKLSPFVEFTHTLLTISQSVAIDIEKMARILADLIDNPKMRKKIGKNAFESASNKYPWNKVIPRYEQLYFELSEEAIRDRSKIGYSRHFIVPPYFDAFSHYPKNMLNSFSEIKCSDLGNDWLNGRRSLISYNVTSVFNEQVLMNIVLKGCCSWSKTDIFLSPLSDDEKEVMTYQILNMIKHGLLLYKP